MIIYSLIQNTIWTSSDSRSPVKSLYQEEQADSMLAASPTALSIRLFLVLVSMILVRGFHPHHHPAQLCTANHTRHEREH